MKSRLWIWKLLFGDDPDPKKNPRAYWWDCKFRAVGITTDERMAAAIVLAGLIIWGLIIAGKKYPIF